MRITIDAAGGRVASWVAALRAQASGEEIHVFESSKLATVLGGPWLDSKLRGTQLFHASPATLHPPRSAKLTATIEDLSAWSILNEHTRAAQQFAERILQPADGLIAVSDSIRQEAIRLLGIEAEKITTIYPGVATDYFDAMPSGHARRYVLYTAGDKPQQNRDVLLAAWRELTPQLQREYDLVSTSDAAGAEQMAGATLFVYPSLYDGFALPVAQAMAARVAVVTSDVSSMPEVGRDAAVLVDPHSSAEIAAAITRLLDSESERAKLARYGRARAEKYRWEKCAADSLAFFRRVAGE